MEKLERIVHTMGEWSQRSLPFALATVVGVRGSTYRGLGARQLVSGEGAAVGTISGGCLDQDLYQVVDRVLETDQPERVEFDLTADDEAIWGWGIGCNGATELVVEPAIQALRHQFGWQQLTGRKSLLFAHLVESPAEMSLLPGLSSIWDKSGSIHRWEDQLDTSALAEPVSAALNQGRHRLFEEAGYRWFLEVVGDAPRLLVCGAGHDAVPLVRFGQQLGFRVVVTDERRQVLTPDRFGETAQMVHGRASELATYVELDRHTAVVIMTHNYLRDLDYLTALLDTEVSYIGMLGPGARLERLIRDLGEVGKELSEDDRAKLHGPAGLDIGAEGPEEISWAILAEILSVQRDASGSPLRQRKGPNRLA